MSIDYDGIVSICDAHGIGLPVDCVEMVVEIVRHATAHPDHSGDGGEKAEASRHVNDDMARDAGCEVALSKHDARSGQGVDAYWAWGFRKGWQECRAALASESAPIAVAEPQFESALAELVNKIDTGLDSGDLLKDARRASTAIDSILKGGDLVACAHNFFRENPDRYENSIEFRIGWDACLDAIGEARKAIPPAPIASSEEALIDDPDDGLLQSAIDWVQKTCDERDVYGAAYQALRRYFEMRKRLPPSDNYSEQESIIRACAFRLREVDSEYLAKHLESLAPKKGSSIDSFDVDILKSLFHAAQLENFDAWCGLVRAFLTGTHPAAAQPLRAEVLTDAARDVLAERQRQITEKGHTVDDDAIYNDQGQMSYAAAGLAVLASEAATDIVCGLTGGLTYADECIGKPEPWPHDWKYKPATPRRNLVVAAAFILAEIERIDYVTEAP
jgi:hypothetical protein